MDEIVRIKTCDFCKREVRERYVGSASELNSKCFETHTSNLILIPPEGKPKSWTLCPSCASNMEFAITDAVRRHFKDSAPARMVS